MMAVLTEKRAHCAALQVGFNRLVADRVKVADATGPAASGST